MCNEGILVLFIEDGISNRWITKPNQQSSDP